MQQVMYLDYRDYADRLLAIEERDQLNGLDIFLYVDLVEHNINGQIYLDPNVLSKEEISGQLHILQKLENLLKEQEDIRSLVWRFKPLHEFAGLPAQLSSPCGFLN